MNSIEEVVAKHGGIVQVSKLLVASGNPVRGLTPDVFTAELTKYAQRQFPNERPDVAFSKLFGAMDDQGAVLRRAWDICKSEASLAPTSVHVEGPDKDDGDDTAAKATEAEAIQALSNMAARQGRSFESVLTDPSNAALARKAHTRPSAVGNYHPFPH
jgi:hypothetical protein